MAKGDQVRERTFFDQISQPGFPTLARMGRVEAEVLDQTIGDNGCGENQALATSLRFQSNDLSTYIYHRQDENWDRATSLFIALDFSPALNENDEGCAPWESSVAYRQPRVIDFRHCIADFMSLVNSWGEWENHGSSVNMRLQYLRKSQLPQYVYNVVDESKTAAETKTVVDLLEQTTQLDATSSAHDSPTKNREEYSPEPHEEDEQPDEEDEQPDEDVQPRHDEEEIALLEITAAANYNETVAAPPEDDPKQQKRSFSGDEDEDEPDLKKARVAF